jgi:hypothetical protein
VKKEVLSFRKDIQPGASETITERIKENGRVVNIRLRFYPGVERELRVRPYVLHKGQKQEDVFTYAGDTEAYITGDDDYLEFAVSIDVEYDDEMKVFASNENATYAYTLVCDVIIVYAVE